MKWWHPTLYSLQTLRTYCWTLPISSGRWMPLTKRRRQNMLNSIGNLRLKLLGLRATLHLTIPRSSSCRNWPTRNHQSPGYESGTRRCVHRWLQDNIPDDTSPVQADPLMDVDAALTPQGIPADEADVTTSTVEVAPPSSSQVPPASEVAEPSQPTNHSSTEDTEGEDDHSDDTAPVAEEAPPPATVPPVAPPAQLFTVKHYFDRDIIDEHLYHLQIVAIPPHRPQRPAIEEDVLHWLRLRRHDCSLQWDGDNLVFRTRCPLGDSAFDRPEGPYTWRCGRKSPIFPLIVASFLSL